VSFRRYAQAFMVGVLMNTVVGMVDHTLNWGFRIGWSMQEL
jgi:hypothetical protein